MKREKWNNNGQLIYVSMSSWSDTVVLVVVLSIYQSNVVFVLTPHTTLSYCSARPQISIIRKGAMDYVGHFPVFKTVALFL